MGKCVGDLSIPYEADKRKNKVAITCTGTMNGILAVSYAVEVLKGNIGLGLYMIMAVLCIVPIILTTVIYAKKKDAVVLRYICSIGFALMYALVMYSKSTNLVFCYVLVIYLALIVYSDLKISVGLGVYAFAINVLWAIIGAVKGELTAKDITETEIALACIVLTCVFSVVAVNTISLISQANMKKAIEEKKQTQMMLETILRVSDSMSLDVSNAEDEMEKLKKSITATKSSMENLAKGAGESAEAVQIQQVNTEEINQHLNHVGEVAAGITKEVEKAEKNLALGQNVMESLLEQVRNSQEISGVVANNMSGLKEYTDRMKEILDMINGVADQTGLLALNASIEAARAGEAGKGFAVVAGEISSLSGQTSSATNDIHELIENIGQSLTEVISAVERLLESNKMQNGYIDESAEYLKQIHQNTNKVLNESANLQKVVIDVSKANETISESIQNISALTQEVTASANETLAGSEVDLHSVEGVSGIVERLSANAEELKKVQ